MLLLLLPPRRVLRSFMLPSRVANECDGVRLCIRRCDCRFACLIFLAPLPQVAVVVSCLTIASSVPYGTPRSPTAIRQA